MHMRMAFSLQSLSFSRKRGHIIQWRLLKYRKNTVDEPIEIAFDFEHIDESQNCKLIDTRKPVKYIDRLSINYN